MVTYRQPFQGEYPITLDYGEEYLPLYKKGEHKGIDYGCPYGTPILASADGVIASTGYQKNGYGYYMIVMHSDLSGTLYAHLSRYDKITGDKVKAGDVIAHSGNSGKSTGAHLHFELRTEAMKPNTAIDPKTKLQSVWDADADIQSNEHPKLHSGWAKIVCESANVRCHCDPNRILGQRKKGLGIWISEDVTMFNGLPYRSYFDGETCCKLLIAEYDGYGTQIIENPN